jgi:8-oxo-dGTP pyrophosphatase MutT (NUDIX family)
MVQPASLLFLLTDTKILLAMKNRGFGMGLYNGVGGKPDSGETISQTAIRECQEEIGVTPIDPKPVGELTFYIEYDNKHSEMHVSVFTATKWKGEPVETEEMAPEWFPLDAIPYDKMWIDDKYWLPEVLAGKFVTGSFTFDDKNQLVGHTIKTKSL